MEITKKIHWVDLPALLEKADNVYLFDTGQTVVSAKVDGAKVHVVLREINPQPESDFEQKVFAGYRQIMVEAWFSEKKKTNPNVLRPGKTERQKEKRARYLQNKAEKAAANRARAQSSGKGKK